MPLIDRQTRNRIRELNDVLRTSFDTTVGKIVITSGVADLPDDVRALAIQKTVTFDTFTAGDGPYGEHDFGSFELAEHRFFFKIDYYDPTLKGGSEDPSDPTKTTRVLTLMLAQEY